MKSIAVGYSGVQRLSKVIFIINLLYTIRANRFRILLGRRVDLYTLHSILYIHYRES